MKKTILAVVAVSVLTVSAQAGGVWDMIKNTNSKGKLESVQYTLPVAGVDTRAYIVNVPDMKSTCFLTYSSQGIPAMDCKTHKEMEGK